MPTPPTTEIVENLLKDYQIRPTAVRIMVWKQIVSLDFAFALADLEGMLPTVDRSTLFRALTLFVERHMLHTIDDGSGQHKYCLCDEIADPSCHASCEASHPHTCQQSATGLAHEECQHVHLSCTICGRTFCLRAQKIPLVEVPEGFQILHTQYLIQGICPECTRRHPSAAASALRSCHEEAVQHAHVSGSEHHSQDSTQRHVGINNLAEQVGREASED